MEFSSFSYDSEQKLYEQIIPCKTPPSNLVIFPISSAPFNFNFIHSAPFLGQPLSSKSNLHLLTMGASNVVRQVQKSVSANVDKFLKMVDDLRSQNAVLDKVMSSFSHLQKCCQPQIPRSSNRDSRNVHMLSNQNFAAILPGDSVAGVVVGNGIMNFLNIYNTLLIVRIVLTWFPNAPAAVVSPLSTLCDPYLNIFRGIIPPLGGTLDLSPILAFLVLNAFTSAAAALPCELPPSEGEGTASSGSGTTLPPLTSSQKKWITRFANRDSPKKPGAVPPF